jgi:alkyl hydroperoxide reductase subunit AhpC
MGVEVFGVSTDTHFAHKAWHDTSEAIKKVNYALIGDPTGTLTRNFDVMIEEEGLALRGTFLINPKARSSCAKSTTTASAVTPAS